MPDDEKTMKEVLEEVYEDLDETEKIVDDIEESADDKTTSDADDVVEDVVDEVDEEKEKAAEEVDKEIDEGTSTEEGAEKLEPLAHWLEKDKEEFENLQPQQQEFLIRRDKEFQRVATAKMQETAALSRSLDPLREELSKSGLSDAQAVRTLVGAHLSPKDNPKQSIKYLMGQYNLSPEELFSEDAAPEVTVDSRRITELENEVATAKRAQVEGQQANSSAKLESFRGNAEFFDEVMVEMTDLAYAARAQNPNQEPDIQAIYDRACWMNESVRAKVIAKQRAEDGTTASTERSKMASKSKVHSTTVAKKHSVEDNQASLHDSLSANFDRQQKLEKTGTAL